jgi:hypothetical protein
MILLDVKCHWYLFISVSSFMIIIYNICFSNSGKYIYMLYLFWEIIFVLKLLSLKKLLGMILLLRDVLLV